MREKKLYSSRQVKRTALEHVPVDKTERKRIQQLPAVITFTYETSFEKVKELIKKHRMSTN